METTTREGATGEITTAIITATRGTEGIRTDLKGGRGKDHISIAVMILYMYM